MYILFPTIVIMKSDKAVTANQIGRFIEWNFIFEPTSALQPVMFGMLPHAVTIAPNAVLMSQ